MIGSVFSPYYAWSGHKAPEDHVAINVGLYGKGVRRWTMTERGHEGLEQSKDYIRMGPSSAHWDGKALKITIHERSAPFAMPVRGSITVTPDWRTSQPYSINKNGRHFWCPIAPSAQADVKFSHPDMQWHGHGYIDSNWGSEMLEEGFDSWDWCRASLPDGAGIYYDAVLKDGQEMRLALHYDGEGNVKTLPCPAPVALNPGPVWRVRRSMPAAPGAAIKTLKMLEDTPFYTRSRIKAVFDGQEATAIHESLDLKRFSQTWVRCLLPFRMPRRRR